MNETSGGGEVRFPKETGRHLFCYPFWVMRLMVALLLAFATAPVALHAQAIKWTIDPGHSAAQFTVRHMLVANVHGEFDGPTGTVTFDPAHVAATLRVDAVLNARSINTRNADRDADLKGGGFFDVDRFPTITFTSTRSTATADGHLSVVGNLSMHGVTREVTLDVEGPSPPFKDLDGLTRVGASATTVVNRRDFGLRYNELLETGGAVVSDEVRISLDIEVTHR
jgi:polyisoprenoid-binding protein YceI